MQRQARVVGVFQSVLELHLHCQAPTRTANHEGFLSVEDTQLNLTEPYISVTYISAVRAEKRVKGYGYIISLPCTRDVHMSLEHQVCCAHVVFTTVLEERDLVRHK